MESTALKAEKMKRIFRGEEAYGDGNPAAQATRYHLDHLLPDIIELAKQKSGRQGPADLLISLSGFSPATTILAYEILRPQKVLIIVSEGSEQSLNVIGEHLVKKGGLPHSKFAHRSCDPSNTLSIYDIVRDELNSGLGAGAARKAVIDITGGKKVMSAAAALAAWQLKLPLCYVECNYDPEMRQPVPGTEHLIWIENPAKFSGDDELGKTCQIFDSGRFDLAQDNFKNLVMQISKPTFVKFMQHLSALYKKWCDLDLNQLQSTMEEVKSDLLDPRVKNRLSPRNLDRIRRQLDFLSRLLDKDPTITLLNLYLLGLHYQDLERHDFAAMLFYRTIEGTLALRLEQNYPGFKCKNPDYALISRNRKNLLKNYKQAAKAGGFSTTPNNLPDYYLGYITSAALLHATDDELFKLLVKAGITNPMSRLHQLAGIRNNSILAHGHQCVTGEESREIGFMAKKLLTILCDIQGNALNVKEEVEALKFVKLAGDCEETVL